MTNLVLELFTASASKSCISLVLSMNIGLGIKILIYFLLEYLGYRDIEHKHMVKYLK